jgi:putative cardiolipin synthase
MRLRSRSIAFALLITAALGGCATLPPGSHFSKRASIAWAHPEETQLGRKFADAPNVHPGDSAFRIISVGVDGFAARMQMIDAAERSLDLQYFIFRQDDTGRLLTGALLRAADRGVHVRVLIDDGAMIPGDSQIRLLAAHPQIEIRTFNPFIYRGDSALLRAVEFVVSHRRLDFRMHNKLLVADNAGALIGGRNIGDQYFQIDSEGQYADDDVFVGGPAVQRLSAKFDDYWNSALAIPVEALGGGGPTAAQLAAYRQRLELWQKAQADGVGYVQRAASGDPLAGIMLGRLPLVWSSAQLVCDSPEKKRVEDGAMVGRLMYEPVARAAAAAQTELLMITPYFVPTPEELKLLRGLRDRNVRVRILTNSLESTTELSAQSGYMRYRTTLLQSGVELYEVRALLGNTRGSGQTAKMSRHGNYGLHAKLFVIDRQKLFVGSMNFDQRSMRLNTEVGLIIDSSDLAQQTAMRFEAMTESANAYQVLLRQDAAGRPQLVWRTREADRPVEYTREPSRNLWRRLAVRLLSLLPIEDEL